MTDFVSPSRASLTDRVYEELKERLMEGRVEPGSRLVIDRLVSDLGVSQTPLREALARLEAEQLVIKSPNRGYTSAPLLNVTELLQLFEVRLMLEPPMTELAVARGGDQLVTRLTASARALARAPRGGTYQEYRQVAEADAAFHETIAEASGNAYVLELFLRLRAHLHTARFYARSGAPGVPETAAEHRAIVDAAQARDGVAAAEAMRTHLQRARARLLAAFDTTPQRSHLVP